MVQFSHSKIQMLKLQEQIENHKVVNHEGMQETYDDQGNVALNRRHVGHVPHVIFSY